jgi:hypothetical protein
MKMANEKTIEDFMSYDYGVKFKKKENEFVLMIPDLCIIVTDASADQAYRKMMTEKEELFRKLLADGEADLIPLPFQSKVKMVKNVWDFSGVTPFVLKTVIVLFAVLVIGLTGSYVVKSAVSDTVSRINSKLVSVNIGEKIYLEAERINARSPEELEKQLKWVRTVVKAFKPFADEVWPLFENCPLATTYTGKDVRGIKAKKVTGNK